MTKKPFALLVLLLIFAGVVFPQKSAKMNARAKISPELTKETVAFLRETAGDVNSLRSLENRISFSAELAGLLWFFDEKEARATFQSVSSDFRQLLFQYDAQLNAAGIAPAPSNIFLPDESSTGALSRKFNKAIAVRRQIAAAIAEHDAQLAYDFFSSTAQVITNPDSRKEIAQSDSSFETQLLAKIAVENVDLAVKYARKSLENGFSTATVELLKKIYAKNPEKGISFGEAIVAHLRSNPPDDGEAYKIGALLDFGAESSNQTKGKSSQPPVFSSQAMREIAELLAAQLLKNEESVDSTVAAYLPQIERYAPSRAAQLQQKFGIKTGVKTATGNKMSAPNQTSNEDESEPAPEDLSASIKAIESGKMSKEAFDKFVAESRAAIADTPDKTQRIAALSALAAQIAKFGDRELAARLMDEAGTLVNPQPKNYLDFLRTAILASGYAEVDAAKSFSLLEDTVFRLNDLISAVVKIGEFIDVNGDLVEDGEIQVGGFGGEVTRMLLTDLGPVSSTVKNLVAADFSRTKALTNRFDRTEVRILAKMLIVRSLFARNDVEKTQTVEIGASTDDAR